MDSEAEMDGVKQEMSYIDQEDHHHENSEPEWNTNWSVEDSEAEAFDSRKKALIISKTKDKAIVFISAIEERMDLSSDEHTHTELKQLIIELSARSDMISSHPVGEKKHLTRMKNAELWENGRKRRKLNTEEGKGIIIPYASSTRV